MNTGLRSLGDPFLAAGTAFSVVFVSGNGFSFDNFSVTVPLPGTMILLVTGLGFLSRRRSRTA